MAMLRHMTTNPLVALCSHFRHGWPVGCAGERLRLALGVKIPVPIRLGASFFILGSYLRALDDVRPEVTSCLKFLPSLYQVCDTRLNTQSLKTRIRMLSLYKPSCGMGSTSTSSEWKSGL